ncbi:MAG: DUF3124 domain-containing protein [Pseudomonadota bacterium]|uniref:DUF3124 domain-containing protein n=1 Tax=Candidatus Desulfatibia profunda TaxID=2841695 RepID=A0A8J6NSX7_9BACT|nr:DUF3124 domain-containing protein [Candidatus Desulfatibia profunda]MBL7181265.1 DUF3124 domain-containing protein [Desulfobacterales bacterium]MBU0698933.1 DUF3124 domain-containing protein [Pseudomonadota bacterium]
MFSKKSMLPIGLILSIAFLFSPAMAELEIRHSKGQTVYVPIYSHIYTGDKEYSFLLTATLSIRNTDTANKITILAVDYYDSNGKLLKKYLETPIALNALASSRYIVKESDKEGGSGAKFIIQWKSAHSVSPPVIESIMIGTRTQQGISFTSRGQVIKEDGQ